MGVMVMVIVMVMMMVMVVMMVVLSRITIGQSMFSEKRGRLQAYALAQ
jgi:hypothetical protein